MWKKLREKVLRASVPPSFLKEHKHADEMNRLISLSVITIYVDKFVILNTSNLSCEVAHY